MNIQQARDHAKMVAQILIDGSKWVNGTSPNGQNLMGTLSIMMAAQSQDYLALDATFHDIIIFGSAAEDEGEPDDVDMMVFDQGFYSNVLLSKGKGAYSGLRRNILSLMGGWFGYGETGSKFQSITNGPLVDLLVLPLAFFTNPNKRREISCAQNDPDFFANAFSCIRRFNEATGEFEKIDLSYFENKYGVNLSELRKIPDKAVA